MNQGFDLLLAGAGHAHLGVLRRWAEPSARHNRPTGRIGLLSQSGHAVRVDYAKNGYTVHVGDVAVCLAELALDADGRRVRGLTGGEAFDTGAMLRGETLHLFTAGSPAELSFGAAPVLFANGFED